MWYYVPKEPPQVSEEDIIELSLYTGNSGFGLLARLLFPRARTVCYLDHECHQAATVVARIQDKILDDAPVAGRIESFDGRPFRGCVDITTASMPCAPHSCAGAQKHLEDPRWLWPHTKRVLEEVRPRVIFMENVLGFKRVLSVVRPQLEALGYQVDVQFVSAAQVGASHRRLRVWLLAYSDRDPPRLEPWWRCRQDRAEEAKHRGCDAAMGDARGVGELQPHSKASAELRGGPRGAAVLSDAAVGDTHGVERRSGGGASEHVETPGRARPHHAGEALGNAPGPDEQRAGQRVAGQESHRGSGAGLGHADGEQHEEREVLGPYTRAELQALERAVVELGYPYGGRCPPLDECYGQQTDADREASHRRNAFRPGLPLFPPGRSESERRRWAPVLERDLGLCPALPKSEIRGVVDGTSGYVDQCRSVGRGLVPVAGAYAMLFMFVRAGLVY